LPASLAQDMAKGYVADSQPPKPFEYITVGPAGSLTSTGDDMAKFMIAHLQGSYNGYRLLPDPERMYVQQTQFVPPLPAFALGFYHEDRNGQRIIGHGGDTNFFHSDLHLLLDAHVGLFISMNSLGHEGAAEPLRVALLHDFLDRYYPIARPRLPTAPTAMADAKLMQGRYWSSRRPDSSFLRILNLLGESTVTALPDGTLKVSDLTDTAHAPKVWREVGRYFWVDNTGASRLSAVVKDGKVTGFLSDDLPPVLVFQPVPGWANASWSLPALWLTLLVLAATFLLWPLQVLVRRRYGQAFTLTGGRAAAYRLTKLSALVQIAGIGAYFVLFSMLLGGTLNTDSSLDPLLIVCKALCMLGLLGVIVEAWNALTVWRTAPSSWWAKLSCSLILLAGLGYAWFVFTLHLATPSLAY
ncbi:MAG TPA: serine hydrolase, partial [Caulobacteraceae bacterium]